MAISIGLDLDRRPFDVSLLTVQLPRLESLSVVCDRRVLELMDDHIFRSWDIQMFCLRDVGALPTTLTRLEIANCSLDNGSVAAIGARLTGLRSLDCSHNYKITDLTPLSALTSLVDLNVSGIERLTFRFVDDIASLAVLSRLRSLNLAEGRLFSLAGIEALTTLTYLDVSNNRLLSASRDALAPLSGLTGLRTLRCFCPCQCQTLRPLSCLTGLNSLGCTADRSTVMADLHPLTNLTKLHLYAYQRNDVALSDVAQLVEVLDNLIVKMYNVTW